MYRIIYKVNSGKTTNDVYVRIIDETDKELTVLINNELERKIKKDKIISISKIRC